MSSNSPMVKDIIKYYCDYLDKEFIDINYFIKNIYVRKINHSIIKAYNLSFDICFLSNSTYNIDVNFSPDVKHYEINYELERPFYTFLEDNNLIKPACKLERL